jgi:threonine dehydrogenase-like Zn-dependent dehydrogenase
MFACGGNFVKAARITEPMKIEVVEVEKPEVEEGQILVRNKIAGICGSDMPFFLRERPMEYPLAPGVPGHECIGVVAQTRCKEYKEGDEVLALPIGVCGFAEYFVSVPAGTVRLPVGDMRDKLVVAQPLGTVIHACRKLFHPLLHPAREESAPLDVGSWRFPGTKVAILGQGPIGLLFTAMVRSMKADPVIGIDLMDYRLEVAMKMGATHVINRSNSDLTKMVSKITDGTMADLVIEAVGKDSTVNDCFALTRRGGTVLAFGVPRKSVYELMFPELFRKELKLLGSVGPEAQIDFPPAVDLVANGKIDISHIISHRMPLDDIQKAFEMAAMKKDGAIKILLEF